MSMAKRDKLYAVLLSVLAALKVAAESVKALCKKARRAVRRNKRLSKALKLAGVCLFAVALLSAYTAVIYRLAAKNAVERYEVRLAEIRAEEAEAARLAAEQDPYTLQLNAEAEALARVLYGVRDNNTDDLKTYCWCVFNRVDNSAFPSTLEDVIAQPNQWMRYDQTNPILENLYQIAREQLDAWHTGSHRPVSSEYVFMSWSSNDICLRDNFYEGSGVHYWRWGQK